jgi:hypothetical protein
MPEKSLFSDWLRNHLTIKEESSGITYYRSGNRKHRHAMLSAKSQGYATLAEV